MNTMNAWDLVSHDGPLEGFRLAQHPTPEPTAQQVRIAVEGFGLNYADVMAAQGLYREAPPLPSVLGYEVVGRVEACGAAVPEGLLGKRVVAMTRFGGYAQQAVTDHRACAVIPEALPVGEAAALATQGATAWYAARMLCPLWPGQRVLVHSAAGGVGQLLVQLALDAGCTVYALAGGADKQAHLKRMGAQHVIDRNAGDYGQALRKLLGKDRLDVSFNAVAGSTYRTDLGLLGTGGRLVLFGGAERGTLGAFGTLRFVWRMGLMMPIFLMMRSRSVLGINMLRLGDHKPEVVSACLAQVVQAHAQGILKPHVHREYSAGELPQAHVDLSGGRTMGKLVVRW
ncbi:MAG TPA: zinc-binding dehydrogenase [Flavobacteriales bacterium]|nr:zinc-binding dehydrogenase [Flavobacteriales bacterium]